MMVMLVMPVMVMVDHDGSKETPPYWTVTFHPTIGNESEGSRRYLKLETESITLNVRKSNLND